jgi:hypothetical protein
MRACTRCFDAYQDAVLLRGMWTSDESAFAPAHDLIAAGRQLTPGGAVRSEVEAWRKQTRPGLLRARRLSIVASCAVVVLIAVILLMRPSEIGRVGDEALNYANLLPVRNAVETFSTRGHLVLPGSEHALDETDIAYRSGFVPLSDPLESSFRLFHQAFQDGDSSADLVYWLISGYIATGQIDAARDFLSHPRVVRVKDSRIIILKAIVSYLDQKYDQSEAQLRDLIKENLDHPVASINLAIVLHEQSMAEESRAILNRVARDHAGTPLATRAQSILRHQND